MMTMFGGLIVAAAVTAGSGTSFDFAAISKRRFDPRPISVDIATNKWLTGEWLHMSMADENERTRLMGIINEHTHYCEKKNAAGETERYIIKDHAMIEGLAGNWQHIKNASGCYMQKIPTDGKGGRYRASMEYKTCHYGHRSGSDLQIYGATGSYSDYPMIWHLVGENWNTWSYYRHDFDVKPGVKDFTVYVRCYGLGDLGVRKLRVERLPEETAESPIEIELSPMRYLDNRFAVSQNQPGVMYYDWRKVEDRVKGPYEFVLALPKGFEVVDLMFAKDGKWTETPLADGSREYRCLDESGEPGRKFNGWAYHGVMVTSSERVGTTGVAKMYVACGGKRVSNVEATELYVVPTIRCEATPKRYWNGFHQASSVAFVSKRDEVNERYAKFFHDCGMRIAKCAKAFTPFARKAGFEKVLYEVKVSNGFQIGEAEKAPASEKYVGTPDLPKYERETTVCPTSVYQEKPFFKNETLPLLKRQTEGCDGIWANWEPYKFENRGCMCMNCCAEYAKWLNLPYEEVAKDWPACIDRYKGRLGKEAIKFRSWQHAQLVRTINKYITEFTGGEGKSMGFCVGVEHGQMMSNWRELGQTPEVAVIDYAKYTPWLDPWGPYSGVWDVDAPYVYSPGYAMLDFFNALDCREAADHDWPHVKLLSLPHGIQCGNKMVIQPEHLEMNLDAYFFANWDASTIYFFPHGYDARYFQAIANATARAAEYESYVKDGRRIDDRVTIDFADDFPPALVTAHPTLWASGADFVNYKNPRLMQTIAWERKDGARIVVCFNFREDGPAKFKVRFKGEDDAGATFTVPACRTAVLAFSPR